jgi:TonB family protein
MYLDFEDYRPDTPRIASAFSVREGILLSLVIHAAFVILILLAPDALFSPAEPVDVLAQAPLRQQEPLRFVEVVPMVERPAPPRRPAPASDLDRRSSTMERAPVPENTDPLSRGNSPEMILGRRSEPAVAAGTPEPTPPEPAPRPETEPTVLPETSAEALSVPRPQPPARPAQRAGNLGNAFQNLEQYLDDEVFENSRGGQTEQEADIQIDTRGVDFGPWLRRFKNQVERNWIVPPAAMSMRGRVVIRFYVLRNGTIVDVEVLQPGPVPALTSAAVNALKLSNPTAQLPPEYPIDRALITASFHYNEPYREAR